MKNSAPLISLLFFLAICELDEIVGHELKSGFVFYQLVDFFQIVYLATTAPATETQKQQQ